MRVLFVDHETRLSGGQRDLVDLVRGLRPDGLELHAALPGEGPLAEALRDHGVTVHFAPMGRSLRQASRWDLARRPWSALGYVGAALAAALRLVRLACGLRPEVVHTNSLKAHLLAVPAARAVRSALVWHVRDILEEGWLKRWFARAAGRIPDRVVCLSQAAARQFDASTAEGKVRVVYNGVRPEPTAPEEVNAWRDRLGGGDGRLLVGMVGQIARWKGQDVFVEAAARVAEDLPAARFAVVGECLFPENESEYERAIHEQASHAGLDGRLVWPGPVKPIEPVMAAFDVLVHASRLPEPFGRVIVEALAQGTPVVTTDLGAGPELMTADVGKIVPAGDPEALARAILALLADENTRAAMGRAARARAAEFDIEHTAAGVGAIYAELAVRRPPTPGVRPGPAAPRGGPRGRAAGGTVQLSPRGGAPLRGRLPRRRR